MSLGFHVGMNILKTFKTDIVHPESLPSFYFCLTSSTLRTVTLSILLVSDIFKYNLVPW